MTNEIHDRAERIRARLLKRGVRCGDLAHSINRYGEASSYFMVSTGVRLRISDHSCNTDWRVDEMDFWGEDPDAIDALAESLLQAVAERQKRSRESAAAFAAERADDMARRAEITLRTREEKSRNDEILAARGLSHLTGSRRHDALKKIRKGVL
ncbi:hypothetical protein [Acidomonas methanolica]|uniref:Uncharacterized protein n=1 Tax=Acidomonas methanolica NBRC 104435 TaxID=1231351 RepID=A0A023D6H5_ACIMT|nr:hypothetical protein [Acidomonas methanolica]TCS24096.1 hypothetical protein EDC31_12517 [Acidomonas methanolica]GAJ29752.1 hypothetical protein Amme_076_045 [Acidomonas methanolica NBRC 104435]GBQ59368.1 hypothetical protein AA0498_2737 [Acidomonas methanolica]GEL00011.1 hypothetical protein AME01nite_25090 [Acidomonas methanolica NBRC 104435]